MKDPYQILKVSRTDSLSDIKKKYRRLVKKYHPDISNDPNAEKKIRIINRAWEEIEKTHHIVPDPETLDPYHNYNKYTAEDFKNFKIIKDIVVYVSDIHTGGRNLSYMDVKKADLDPTKNYKLLIDYREILLKRKAQIYNITDRKIVNDREIKIESFTRDEKYIREKFDFDEVMNVITDIYVDKKVLKKGGKIQFKTISQTVIINIKPNTKKNTKIKLKEKGIQKSSFNKKSEGYTDFYAVLREKSIFSKK